MATAMDKCGIVLRTVWSADEDGIFHAPLTPDAFCRGGMAAYKSLIKRPMDLTTAAQLLQQSGDVAAFRENVLLMFSNCELYNRRHCRLKAFSPKCKCVACVGKVLRTVFEEEWSRQFDAKVNFFVTFGIEVGQRVVAHVLWSPLLIYGQVLGFGKMNGHDILLFDPRGVLNFHLRKNSSSGVVDSAPDDPETFIEPWEHKVVCCVRGGVLPDNKPDLPPVASVWTARDSATVIGAIGSRSPLEER